MPASCAQTDSSASVHEPDMHIVVFSKDRACQLDCLLRSIRDHIHYRPYVLHVLYRASDENYERGYALLRERSVIDGISWVAERRFRDDLIRISSSIDNDSFVLVLVDDCIVFRPLQPAPLLSAFTRSHLFISLRVSRTYTSGPLPRFLTTERYLEWKWNHLARPYIWHYPFSVDGNVFRASDWRRATGNLQFRAPNSLEGALHKSRHALRYLWKNRALAPLEAAVVNNPLNRVQQEGATWHRNVATEELNEEYLAGRILDGEFYYGQQPDNVHFAMEPRLVSRRRD